jgi:hypothetical protein
LTRWPASASTVSSKAAGAATMSTAHTTCSANPDTAATSCSDWVWSFAAFRDSSTVPPPSTTHTQWWVLPTSTPAQTSSFLVAAPTTHAPSRSSPRFFDGPKDTSPTHP